MYNELKVNNPYQPITINQSSFKNPAELFQQQTTQTGTTASNPYREINICVRYK